VSVRLLKLLIRKAVDGFNMLRSRLDQRAKERGAELLEARLRLRVTSHFRGVSHSVEAQPLPDALVCICICLEDNPGESVYNYYTCGTLLTMGHRKVCIWRK